MGCCSIFVPYSGENQSAQVVSCPFPTFSPNLHLCFFIPVIFIFPFLPHLSWFRYLDKLESSATHTKDCLHWNILVWRRIHAHRFSECTLTLDSIRSVICSKLLIVPVFPVIILLWNLWALISKDLLIRLFCVRVTSCGAQSGIRRCLIEKNFNARTSQGDLKLQFLLAPNIKQVPWQQAVLPSWWVTLFRESELVIIWHINSVYVLSCVCICKSIIPSVVHRSEFTISVLPPKVGVFSIRRSWGNSALERPSSIT